MLSKETTCGLVGYGKLGTALAKKLSEKFSLLWICDHGVRRKKRDAPKVVFYEMLEEIDLIPEYVFLAVNDDNLESVCVRLSEKFGSELKGKKIIAHSGVLPLKVLDSCASKGAEIFMAHPYQTFYFAEAGVFEGVPWTVRARKNAKEAENIVERLGGRAFRLDDDPKILALYHASAVAFSNFTAASIALGEELASLAGIDAKIFALRIIETSIANSLKKISSSSRASAPITGPYARGDLSAAERHLAALADEETLKAAFARFALAASEIARKNGILSDEKFEALSKRLKKEI